ncbi:nucleotidyltransferase family protein [Polaribacter sp. BM10]|uniref:nucleotidyltransferase family protein n=1 Tax=Polaribacter sp. BM10 TaxID=1529069 RepID=UPI0020C7B8D1|nr:nucleotidyltransferase family protein [Polaribacter sp. BM10]
MNYKETLFFVAKCLTITLEEKNRIEIEDSLKNTEIDWDSVVKVSTQHFVFPALYCNLKRVNLLQYLPEELVNYMIHITDLNRERNKQIIEQAKEINSLLLANEITPIFLKGTGNLLEGLYADIAERMVGDIDFIVSKNDYINTIKLIKGFGYNRVSKENYQFPKSKHYHRLAKEKRIAAIEIHKELLIEKYASEFNYDSVKKNLLKINEITVLSYDDQISLSIIAKQINDDGIYFKDIALRNAYDVFLLSKKTTAKEAFKNLKILKNPLNSFLASTYVIFNKVSSLEYQNTMKTEKYLQVFNDQISNRVNTKRIHKNIGFYLFVKKRLNIILKSIVNKEFRK